MKSICLTKDEITLLLSEKSVLIRRELKTQPLDVLDMAGQMYGKGWIGLMYRDPHGKLENNRGTIFRCRYANAGDFLWVKEKWAVDGSLEDARRAHEDVMAGMTYGPYYEADKAQQHAGHVWRPAITMPRWCSRMNVWVDRIRCYRRDATNVKSQNIPRGVNPWCWHIQLLAEQE